MRTRWTALIMAACTATTGSQPEPEVVPQRISLAELAHEDRVQFWPNVELVPENGLHFRVDAGASQSLMGHDFRVFRVDGDQAIEVVDAITRWRWNGPRVVAELNPVGLRRGAPYRLVVEGLVDADGVPYPTFSHAFRVIPADHKPPSGSRLSLRGKPVVGSSAPLTLTFPEPVHEDSVHHLATLVDGQQNLGTWTLDASQTVATYASPGPWGSGPVVVSVGAGIRDLGGNQMVDLPIGFLTPMVPFDGDSSVTP